MRRAMVVALGALVASAPAHGAVVAASAVHDFGTVEQGAPVGHQFALKNKSRGFLRIESTQPSCDCTVTASEGQLVRPGDITWVTVWLDTAALSGRTTKTVTVRTSDPQTPALQLAMTGVVLADLVAAPNMVYVGHVMRGEPMQREIVVSPGRPGRVPYTVSAVESDSPALRTYVTSGDKPDQQKVIVELDPEAPAGRFTDHITIRTTSPRQPAITVPVFGNVFW